MPKTMRPIFSIKALNWVLLFTIASPVMASTDCDNLKGCEKKFCEIESQLKIAQEKYNEGKVDGLTKSLSNAKKNCTDKALKEELIDEIKSSNDDLAEYKTNLKEAKEYREEDKIYKYQSKIKEEESKLKYLEGKLSELD